MKFLIYILFCFQFHLGMGQDIPYRSEDLYKLTLKMEYKTEVKSDVYKLELANKTNPSAKAQLHLIASLELLSLLDIDNRIKVFNNKNGIVISKKLKSPDVFLIKLGYANYIKSKKTSNVFKIQFFNKEKEVTSQIILEIKENGDFMVNGKRFGKI